ncbi:MAG TPA: DUF1501 domain-containing protein [Gemmataceae bacterium]|nr:DUF1501 domain-containing protein [Gemmataceae bacterium]
MQPTRRDFLRLGLGTSSLLACGSTSPVFLARSGAALAATPEKNDGHVLVVVQLDGGNDGLNTVVPHRDDEYRKRRPRLRLVGARLHKVDDRTGLHPSLTGFAQLLDQRQLAIVQSVGYPNPNRSHFESMAIWHTARAAPKADTPGWLTRYLGVHAAAPGGDAPALHVANTLLPQALLGGERQVPSLESLEQFRRRLGVPESAGAKEQRAALDTVGTRSRGGPGSLVEFVQRSQVLTYASSARLEEVVKRKVASDGYSEFYGLARRLRLIAQLIKAGLGTRLYYTQLDGFDTHANQLGTHDGLLREVGDSLRSFLDDLGKSGDAGRVLVLVFSEFGRRLSENASGGTDHGTAAPVFLLGPGVKEGLHGPHPNLGDLADGDPKHAIDFRRVYATLLESWLGCPSESVLGEKFASIPILRAARR